MTIVRSPLPTEDLASWAGIRLTTPARTAFDLARRGPVVEGVAAVDALLAARQVSRRSFGSIVDARERWPGLRRARRVLDLGDAGAASPMESRLRLVLVLGGLPRSVTQFTVRTSDGVFVARLDLAYPAKRLGVEYEGDQHRGQGAFQQDLRRQNALGACGWTVLRFGPLDIYRDPGGIVAKVRAALGRDRHEQGQLDTSLPANLAQARVRKTTM
jgi:very-short-patch-repair endonuclease